MLRESLGSKPALEPAPLCGCGDARSGSAKVAVAPKALAGSSTGLLTESGIILATVVGFVASGEWSAFLERLTDVVAWPAWLAAILLGG